MSSAPIHHKSQTQKPELTERQKRARPNRLRQAQVLPPHQVDLTLHPVTHEDVHVPAHVNGADLSREAPAGGSRSQKKNPGAPH
ncbi:hypothetical protein [Rhizobium sp. NPDC090279]|uniref:hypothetical protein n=1 Tax=Rhizobium sp. NPDC090279 TaxID=3364499 RepID=UPI00383A4791